MPGANYMGGKRNAAKARLKDVTGRAQKGHFVKQRHQILVQGLQGNDRDVRNTNKGRLEDIDLAHAKRDMQNAEPKTTNPSSILNKRTHNSLVPTTSSSDYEPNLRASKILKTLDIEDPYSLRATMDDLLKLPDFAGLSTSVKRRALGVPFDNRPEKIQKVAPVYDSPLPPSSPQVSSVSHSSRNLDVSDHLHPGSDRDSSSTRQLPIAEDDSSYDLKEETENYRNEFDPNTQKTSQSDKGPQGVEASFLELRGSSLPRSLGRYPLSDRPTNSVNEDTFLPQPEVALKVASTQHSRLPQTSNYQDQDYEQDLEHESASQQITSQDSLSLVLDFPKEERAYSHPSEICYPQGDQDVNNYHLNGISLLEVEQPWLALDEILGFDPALTIENDVDPFQFLTDIGRRGLGYESPQKHSHSSVPMENDLTSVPRSEEETESNLRSQLILARTPTNHDTRSKATTSPIINRPSLRSFVSNIPSHVEENLLILPSSSPLSKSTSSSTSVTHLKTPSTEDTTSPFAPSLIQNNPLRRPQTFPRYTWNKISVSQSLVDSDDAPSAEATVSESLYQMLFNDRSTGHKLASTTVSARETRPLPFVAQKVQPSTKLQSGEKTVEGPDLFANDDDDY